MNQETTRSLSLGKGRHEMALRQDSGTECSLCEVVPGLEVLDQCVVGRLPAQFALRDEARCGRVNRKEATEPTEPIRRVLGGDILEGQI